MQAIKVVEMPSTSLGALWEESVPTLRAQEQCQGGHQTASTSKHSASIFHEHHMRIPISMLPTSHPEEQGWKHTHPAGDDKNARPQERLLPGHHAETLSGAQLAPGGSASDEGSSEPESLADESEGLSHAENLPTEQRQHRGTKRGRGKVEEGARPESLAGRDTDRAG